jgi:hypothetical protein
MEALAPPLALAVIFAFIGYRQWLRHQQRVLIHKERLTALEKGADLPAWPEPPRASLGVRNILLLSGLIWLAVGLGGMVALFAIVPQLHLPEEAAPPFNIGLVGIPVALIGVAHLIVYARLPHRD